jgi:hypothetical protein
MPPDKPDGEVKFSSYTVAQKNATKKYRANNKEKVNEQRKLYYKARKEKDPNFLEYKRQKAKEYYLRKKNEKVNYVESPLSSDNEPIKSESEASQSDPEVTHSSSSESEPELVEVKHQKPKLKRSKKKSRPETPAPIPETETLEIPELQRSPIIEGSLDSLLDELVKEPLIEVKDEGLEALKEWRPTMIMIGGPSETDLVAPKPVKKTKKSKKENKDT